MTIKSYTGNNSRRRSPGPGRERRTYQSVRLTRSSPPEAQQTRRAAGTPAGREPRSCRGGGCQPPAPPPAPPGRGHRPAHGDRPQLPRGCRTRSRPWAALPSTRQRAAEGQRRATAAGCGTVWAPEPKNRSRNWYRDGLMKAAGITQAGRRWSWTPPEKELHDSRRRTRIAAAPAGPLNAQQRRRWRLSLQRKPGFFFLIILGWSRRKRCVSSNNSPTPLTKRQKNTLKQVSWQHTATIQNVPETPNVVLSDLQVISKTARRCSVPDPEDLAGSAKFLPRCLNPAASKQAY